jgi:hypothetical protein
VPFWTISGGTEVSGFLASLRSPKLPPTSATGLASIFMGTMASLSGLALGLLSPFAMENLSFSRRAGDKPRIEPPKLFLFLARSAEGSLRVLARSVKPKIWSAGEDSETGRVRGETSNVGGGAPGTISIVWAGARSGIEGLAEESSSAADVGIRGEDVVRYAVGESRERSGGALVEFNNLISSAITEAPSQTRSIWHMGCNKQWGKWGVVMVFQNRNTWV